MATPIKKQTDILTDILHIMTYSKCSNTFHNHVHMKNTGITNFNSKMLHNIVNVYFFNL